MRLQGLRETTDLLRHQFNQLSDYKDDLEQNIEEISSELEGITKNKQVSDNLKSYLQEHWRSEEHSFELHPLMYFFGRFWSEKKA